MENLESGAEGRQLEGMKMVTAKLGVCVHPAWASNVQQGVREILNSLLLRYNDDFDGVVLAYLDLIIPGLTANVLPGLSPYFKVDLTTKLLLFSPKSGMMLEGKVNKIEKDYIGVLVLGLFNAAIGVTDIRREFYYDEEVQAWLTELDEQHVIKLGTIIRFLVKSVQEKDDFLDIAGSLEPSTSGSIDWFIHKSRRHRKRIRKEERKELKEHEGNFMIQEVMYADDGGRKEQYRISKKKREAHV